MKTETSPRADEPPYVPEPPVVPPPATATVEFQRKPVLYLPDGRVLVRRAGF